jgi:outer membrane cobalamin receptor
VSDQALIIVGLEGEIERLSESFSLSHSGSQFLPPPAPGTPASITNRLLSVYTDVHYALTGQLSVIGGLRQDFSDYYGSVTTPRTGLVLNTSNLAAKLLYGEAFRAPKPWDYTFGLGNDGLEPERMRSLEISMTHSLSCGATVSASVYRNTVTDKLTQDRSPAGDRWVNKNKLTARGIELSADYRTGDLSAYANFTFADSYDQDGKPVPEISQQTANAGITYSCLQQVRVHVRANFLGERQNPGVIPSTGTATIGDVVVFHGCLSYLDLGGVDFQLRVNNIFNAEYYHPSNRFAGRYRQPQRTFALACSYDF